MRWCRGTDFESFKEVLTDRGIGIRTATPTEEELEKERKERESGKDGGGDVG